MPSHGRTITKITQSVLPPPPRSLLRKMSPRTQNRHMNHAKNRKNSNKASRNEPLSLNIQAPFQRAETVGLHRLSTQPSRITGRWHPPARMRRRTPRQLATSESTRPLTPLSGRVDE